MWTAAILFIRQKRTSRHSENTEAQYDEKDEEMKKGTNNESFNIISMVWDRQIIANCDFDDDKKEF